MAAPDIESSGRVKPRISTNDLALYMVSTETAKLGIIRRNKYPSFHVTSPYQKAKKSLIKYLTDNYRDDKVLYEAREDFESIAKMGIDKPSKIEDAKRSIEAIDAFFDASNTLGLSQTNFYAAPEKLNPLIISDVEVSVRIDMLTKRTVRKEDREGGVILRLTKPVESDAGIKKRAEMGHYAATLAFLQIADKKPLGLKPDAKICLAFDIQQKEKYEARAGSQRISNLKIACQMIAAVWPSV